MSIILRPYQEELMQDVRIAMRTHKRILIQAPTGAGKTALAAKMMGNAAEKKFPSLFIVHRRELIEQTAKTFTDVGIDFGFCASGYDFNPYAPTLICGIDTLKNRVDKLWGRRFIMWDEAHHAAAAGWAAVASAYPEAFHIGLSATPERLDGKGLNAQFDHLIPGPRVSWLIEQGYLCNYRAFAPTTPDLKGVGTLAGDFNKAQLEAVLDGSALMGDMVKHYKELSYGRRAVAFCYSVEKSVELAAQFNLQGIKAASLDGTTDREVRKRVIQMFRDGEIDVLCNVDLFGEGFDLPAMETVILGRPTQSLSLFMQQVGRGLRPFPGKKYCLILDHAGNLARHGLPDQDRDWSLEGRDKKARKGTEETRQCPKCYRVHQYATVCPGCGHRYNDTTEGAGGRIVEEMDGELKEIDIERERLRRRQEQGMAQTVEELMEIATARGMKSPEQWVAHVWTARQAKKREMDQRAAQRAEDQARAYRRY